MFTLQVTKAPLAARKNCAQDTAGSLLKTRVAVRGIAEIDDRAMTEQAEFLIHSHPAGQC